MPGERPDPTPRSTQQVLRENFWLRELLEAKLTTIEMQIKASQEAVRLLQDFANRTPTTSDVHHEVEQLREVVMEKFGSINTTFTQKDVAVKDAFQAQEKQAIATTTSTNAANTKMEDSFTKQIDAIGKTRESDTKSIDDKINDVKDRLTKIESKGFVTDPRNELAINQLSTAVGALRSGADTGAGNKVGQAAVIAMVISVISLLLGLAGAVGLAIKVIR